MGDTIYIDPQGIEMAIYNALVENLPDFTPLLRAAYVRELEMVERRLEALGQFSAMHDEDDTLLSPTPEHEGRVLAMWKRRRELLGLLWPELEAPANGGVAPELQKAADEGMGC